MTRPRARTLSGRWLVSGIIASMADLAQKTYLHPPVIPAGVLIVVAILCLGRGCYWLGFSQGMRRW